MIIGLTFGTDTIVKIEWPTLENGIKLKDCMPMGVPTKSKTKTLPKICKTLGGIHIDVFIIDEITRVKVDTDNVDGNKIVELTTILTNDAREEGANSVAKEVTDGSVDEVLDTSIEVT